MKKKFPERSSGILLPIFSLPSKYGMGCFSDQARSFIDFLRSAGQSYWQILPLGPVNESRSPYQAPSSFAGNPEFIDPEELLRLGLVTEEQFSDFERSVSPFSVSGIYGNIDYVSVLPPRLKLRLQAYEGFLRLPAASPYRTGFDSFTRENKDWLDDYALFETLEKEYGDNWSQWPEKYRLRDPEALAAFDRENSRETEFIRFQQYEFFRELESLHAYARSAGIKLIGDLPIYTACESADCWSHPGIFQLDKDLKPEALSGCPPDAFAPGGQLWNNPLYRWHDAPEKTAAWWAARLAHSLKTVDMLRLDHFRGFESYFSIPADRADPALGHWEKGPGADFFRSLPEKAFPSGSFIAEDLGSLTPEVFKLRDSLRLPGMKILQFAFDSDRTNPYLPDNFGRRCVIYTGTHDNDTTAGWYSSLSPRRRNRIRHFISAYLLKHRKAAFTSLLPPDRLRRWTRADIRNSEIAEALTMIAQSSKAGLCLLPLQDILSLGSGARINTPGIASGNWTFELGTGLSLTEYAGKLQRLSETCGRV
ncbi:MAG: 4-alpha-glucanotransferase [Anaerovoracaceae bacterium]|nr:4-alpha-glucanotransferase [Bacillota bacterium]MDY2671332.1 4-alpha-glucanotransferase [Anaerovoracaceae bacterium]